MIVVRDTEILKGKRLVATIGFFDGVHLGHCFLIHELKQVAEAAGLPSAVITFPEHPRAVLHSDYQPKLLNSFEEKLKHLASTGIDYCIVLDFTPGLSRLSAKEFIMSVLANQLQVGTLLIGYDHRFGHNREDGFEQYVAYGEACGIRVVKASQYSEGEAAVSSSEIRRLLTECKVEEAARLLGYPYQLKGHRQRLQSRPQIRLSDCQHTSGRAVQDHSGDRCLCGLGLPERTALQRHALHRQPPDIGQRRQHHVRSKHPELLRRYLQ